MKALNRAIGRTVSQLARYGSEGGPLTMGLSHHLDELLKMEREQLAVAGIKIATLGDKSVVNITSTGCAGHIDAKAVAERILRDLGRAEANKVLCAMAAPAPGASPADEAPTPAYQVGDMLECIGRSDGFFTTGKLYPVVKIGQNIPVFVTDDDGREHGLSSSLKDFINRGQPAPRPAPDVIDMTYSRNWQPGDVVICNWHYLAHFQRGNEYRVQVNSDHEVKMFGDDGSVYSFLHGVGLSNAGKMFTWLRHA